MPNIIMMFRLYVPFVIRAARTNAVKLITLAERREDLPMGEHTKISWCDHTMNPWIGCTKVGPGCDACYAETMDSRKRWDGGKTHWGPGVPRYRTSESNWRQPLAWNRQAEKDGKPHRVFCASLADVFDNEVQFQWRADLWKLIEATQNLSWLLVTKRIGNVERMVPHHWLHAEFPAHNGFPPNVRLLITVCNQEEADRDIPKLLALPAKNGLSIEPQLSPVDLRAVVMPDGDSLGLGLFSHGEGRGIEWCIQGGESGPKARPFDIAWVRSTIAQCKEAGVPVFMKQCGAKPIWGDETSSLGRALREGGYTLKDRAGADPSEWPEDLRVREFPCD